jgi:alpha/beta hydrolase family protein
VIVVLARKIVAAASLAALLAVGLPATQAGAARGCTDRADASFPTKKIGISGLFALPQKAPKTLVVFDHGYRKAATEYWDGHIRDAANHGVIAVAPDYTGIGPAPDYRGWNVSAGARDSIKAAQYFLARCSSVKQVVILGISMGGNASGLAVAAGATRPDGSPLFDYWIDVEGATNVTETYFEARAVSNVGNEYADGAYKDIEAEMGGTFDEVPDRYAEESVVTRGADIAASGLKGAVLVHGFDDGLVPYDQSREMANTLRAEQIPVEFYSIAGRGKGESGTTLSGSIVGAANPDYESPFAGHGAEESDTQLVIKTAFERLWELVKGTAPTANNEVFIHESPESRSTRS